MQLKSPGVAACVAAFIAPSSATAYTPNDEVAVLRAQGPAALDRLLNAYDHTPASPARNALAELIDQVAAQRYATVARLYWYTDLGLAQAASRGSGRPILALRMLGRLDEDLSCANSRLFRATLYANASVSRFLRDHFVLYWSTERAVPKVTIDFGDGRKLERTTTGNSAHYVLDAEGNVLDVLPGLYAPAVFVDELGKSLAFAKRVRGMASSKLVAARAAYHRAGVEQRAADFDGMRGGGFKPTQNLVASLQEAQRATMSKMRVEVPDLRRIGMTVDEVDEADVAQWTAIGARLWGPDSMRKPWGPVPKMLGLFDAQSLALIRRLHGGADLKVPMDDVIARLETSVIADTAVNELKLRGQIRALLAGSKDLRFEPLNAWVYETVFHTPKADAWLGLLPRSDFSGLPGDGVVMP